MPRILGELLKLGIDIGQTSVATYMIKGLARHTTLRRNQKELAQSNTNQMR